jgi:competence ComEA-like helix-hairpin-helix protein
MGGYVGAVFGAYVGVTSLGRVLFVPALLMIAGGLLGAFGTAAVEALRGGRSAGLGVQRMLAELLELPEPQARRPKPAASRPEPATGTASAARAPAAKAPRTAAAKANGAGPVRPAPIPEPMATVNINVATVQELSMVSGIGWGGAVRIVDHRERNGPFGDTAQLADVEKFGEARVRHVIPLVTVAAAPLEVKVERTPAAKPDAEPGESDQAAEPAGAGA